MPTDTEDDRFIVIACFARALSWTKGKREQERKKTRVRDGSCYLSLSEFSIILQIALIFLEINLLLTTLCTRRSNAAWEEALRLGFIV